MDKEVFENSTRHLAPRDEVESCVFTVHGIHLSLQRSQMLSAEQHEKAEFRARRRKGGRLCRRTPGQAISCHLTHSN